MGLPESILFMFLKIIQELPLFHYYYHFTGLQVIWNSISTTQILINLQRIENFIVVHPNGISNTWTVSANDDTDINFIVALLNQLEEDYNIESNRIYSTGMSMGGFFSFSLACRLSDRIAAVASVTGSMYQPAINNCSPVKPMPILQIHGTEDVSVQYSSVAGLLDFWTSHNNTDAFTNYI